MIPKTRDITPGFLQHWPDITIPPPDPEPHHPRCRGYQNAPTVPWIFPGTAAAADAAAVVETGRDGVAGAQAPEFSILATLRAHRGRVLQARWRPTGPPAFLTSSTDCSVMLWSLPQPQMRE